MRAYERLLDYVKVYTTSDPESGTHPSAAREFDLAHKLVEELKALGPARHPRLRGKARAGSDCPHGHRPGCQRREREPHPAREL